MTVSLRRLVLPAGIVMMMAGAGVNYASIADDTEPPEKGLRLVVNVAGNRLHVYENGKRTETYQVSVGLRGFETPAGEYTIREVIWNPWWHPPSSNWARGREVEPPGPKNPMGRVKLMFAPLLYIHGTPESDALGGPASRGCVRMRNADVLELTRLVHRYASPRVEPELLAQLEASPTMTRKIRLARPIRVSAVYDVATVENGFLIIYPDHYGKVKKQVRAQVDRELAAHGIDLKRVNNARLNELVQKSGAGKRVAIALDSLVVGAGAADDDTEARR